MIQAATSVLFLGQIPLLALSGMCLPFFTITALAVLAASFRSIKTTTKKALLFGSCCLNHLSWRTAPTGTSKHPYFVRCVTAEDKQGEGRYVQIHTTQSTATLQNRRCSSVALHLFLVLQASCPPYNLVTHSDHTFRFALWCCARSWNVEKFATG